MQNLIERGHPAGYYKSCLVNARAKLAEPNVRYPNGRMSHDLQMQVATECEEILDDMALDGRYTVTEQGMRFHSYADGTPA